MSSSDSVLVPREPTEAMLGAACMSGMVLAGSDLSSEEMTTAIWSAMLAASPQQSPISGEGAREALEAADKTLTWLWINTLRGAPAERCEAAMKTVRAALSAPPVPSVLVGEG